MKAPVVLLCALSVLCVGAPVRADSVVVTVSGEAPGSGERARVAALDQAFAGAIKKVVADLVEAAVIREQSDRIRVEIVARSRRFVASYRVVEEKSEKGLVTVRIAATVDRDKLKAGLEALGIRAEGAAERGTLRPKALILARETGPRPLVGSASCVQAFKAMLDGLGFSVIESPVVPVSIEENTELAGSELAIEIARGVKAEAVFVIGVTAVGAGRIRGTLDSGGEAQATARAYAAADGQEVAVAESAGAGFAPTLTEAAQKASADGCDRVGRQMSAALARRWPLAAKDSPNVTVLVTGARNWGPVGAMVRELGPSATGMRVELYGGQVMLGLKTTLTPGQVSMAFSRVKLANAQLGTRVEGARIVVDVQGEQRFEPTELRPAPEEPDVMEGE